MSVLPEPMANQPADTGVEARPARTVRLWHRLVRHRSFQVGSIGVLILAAVAIIGPLLVGDPDQTNYKNKLAAPSAMHWLGTDSNGRDLLSRAVHGAGVSFEAALIVFALTTVIGIGLGVPAGLMGGPFDIFVSRICDVMLGLPSLVLALAVVGALGPGFGNLVLAMSLTGWAGLAKLSRSLALSSRHRPDVLAARMAGIGRARIAVGHVLPGVFAHGLIAATLGLGETILGLAGLSFLGLGVQPPTAEWGSMLNEGRIDLNVAPWLLIGPGIGLVITVTAITLISDALRDCADVSELA
ncbi:peptide/nickel transport system permease protein/oligopeptide transport system permease protein/nickel transport system permease protein [Antricoccus suffuscus]|uniref:Peptide/nickel transport system permease protein/oligopeptide transport system permease protein/nickel transport system permease protein n=1 Tax=Antricoccus suffuscus TaxID=1629062 RepID=A0A2T0ZWN0_9ACTN|nr:ABC transporter permease [Antricoccus suffuscus]PRZ40488.1 peptide/nickel transport system permease protein/oligopeptide transport system permease protein/nickel transport system permease protein [Antricoccus suffuscus]